MDKNVVESQLDLFLGHSLDGFSLIKSKKIKVKEVMK